ncbi:MAG: Fe-S protein assembly co-chaperone HscB [Planctomycetota bacterium]|nr:Fe-S protein assembly co-chaperone HscB [Planctomycetota bacterium]MDP6503357.1 Fe-S protein assembly co-chaperone HscB [Planctomycetota bacterium]
MAVESMPSTEATTCPNCEQKEGDHPLFCMGCGHLFPEDEGANHFALFGLTPTFDIDEGELELKLIDISRRFHPDFFATSDAEQQKLSLQHSASLNTAHQVLRDPFERAEYLVQLLGGKQSSEDKSIPEGFLQKTMLLRMKLEEAVEDNDESAIDALNQQVINESEELLRGMSELFERLNDEVGERNSILAQARKDLNATKYIRNLIHDSSGLQRPDA